MDQPPIIRTAEPGEEERVIAVERLAFAADPFTRWLWPEAAVYEDAMTRLTWAMSGAGFDERSIYVEDAMLGAAMWLPPGVDGDEEAMIAIVQDTVAPDLFEDALALFGEMESYHPRDVPCWYLTLLGCDPAHQGKGVGAELMKYATRLCDEAGEAAYLESSNQRNISLYLRHGFEIVGEIQRGNSPVITPMIRHPQ